MADYSRSGGNPYGSPPSQRYGEPIASHHQPNISTSQVPPPAILTSPDFLLRVEGVKNDIEQLSSNISQIAALHQRSISSTDGTSSSSLENMVSQTQILTTRIRDQIKYLEKDAAHSGVNTTKNSQVRNLKNQFKTGLEQYQHEEVAYKKRYEEQIARQYRIVNPDADDEEVREAMTTDWGNEGIFQTALKSNRTGAAASVLGTVRSRHRDIQQIEQTLIELHGLFQDLAETVTNQEPMVTDLEHESSDVVKHTEDANVHLEKGVASARRARKLKWFCYSIGLVVLLALVIGLIIFFKVVKPQQDKAGHNQISSTE